MKQLTEDLWQSSRYSAGMLNSHAYLLQHPTGNILFYNTGDNADLDLIATMGGLRDQLLTHRDESGPSLARIQQRFGSRLGCSVLEVPYMHEDAHVDLQLTPQHKLLEDIEVIHTPGHTNGSVCYFYRSPHGRSYLFTGDTLFLWNGRWATLVLAKAGGSADALIESLLKLRALQPDMVMSSGFIGAQAYAEMTSENWYAVIDSRIAELRG